MNPRYPVGPSNLNHPARKAYEGRVCRHFDDVIFGNCTAGESYQDDFYGDEDTVQAATGSADLGWVDVAFGLMFVIGVVLLIAVITVAMWNWSPVFAVAALSTTAWAGYALLARGHRGR